ncbi:MAG: helix-turn-helix domain-containing protein [Clostridium perfringens]|nr:helix-turn-helix domain-containing protein [Clostridium perfringens]
MHIETTSTRLKKILEDRGLKQVDLLNLAKPFCKEYNVKMNKSDISQYLSDKAKPGQEKLFILAKALNVNEAWLMGYDVPMEKEIKINPNFSIEDIEDIELRQFIENYMKLDEETKGFINGLVNKALKK